MRKGLSGILAAITLMMGILAYSGIGGNRTEVLERGLPYKLTEEDQMLMGREKVRSVEQLATIVGSTLEQGAEQGPLYRCATSFFRKLPIRSLRQLRTHSNPTVALRSSWHELLRATLNPREVHESTGSTMCDFVRLVEKEVGVQVPEWWQNSVLAAMSPAAQPARSRWRGFNNEAFLCKIQNRRLSSLRFLQQADERASQELCSVTNLELPRENGIWCERHVRVEEMGGSTFVKVGELSLPFDDQMVMEESRHITTDITKDNAVLVFYQTEPLKLTAFRYIREGAGAEWEKQRLNHVTIVASCLLRSNRFTRRAHHAEVMVCGGNAVVFGMTSNRCYIVAFDLLSGTIVLNFVGKGC